MANRHERNMAARSNVVELRHGNGTGLTVAQAKALLALIDDSGSKSKSIAVAREKIAVSLAVTAGNV